MAFWNKKKAAAPVQDDDTRGGSAPVETAAKPDAGAEKQRLKKIRNMKKKFEETVWASALDTMRKSIPQFTMMEPDPDIPGGEIARYVLLGFDTKIVDDFSNKSDEDTGSMMTAIKSSMDCVIENGLFDNELILMIPTPKTLAALSEFEDTFDLKFYVIYVTEDHMISMETRTPEREDDFIYITLPEIKQMLSGNVYIGDQIKMLQGRTGADGDIGGITGEGRPSDGQAGAPADNGIASGDGDDAVSEDDYEQAYGKGVDEEDGPPDEEDGPPEDDEGPEDGPGSRAGEARSAVEDAVKKASRAGDRLGEQKADAESTAASSEGRGKDGEDGAAPPPSGPRPSSARDRIRKLRSSVQSASDQALQDEQIKAAQSAVAPAPAQARPAFDMAAMDQYVTRKYYSDDLELEISSQPFDAMFMQSNPYVPFEEEETDDWLAGYVNNLRKDANSRLAKLHYENLLLMRKRFILIVTKHCEEITKAVSTDDPKSRFGYALQIIDKLREDNLAKIGEQADAYKRECEEAYQSRMRAEMENASAVAKANFINRYGKEHDREMREIETDLRNNIESEHVAAVENLRSERRNEAKRQLDAGISEALKICGDEYTKMLAQERKEYNRLQALITEFMNENMASDEARIQVLAEEHRRGNEAVKVREEYDAQLSLAKADFEARLAAVRVEIDKRDAEHENQVARIQDQYELSMQQLRSSHNETLQHKDAEIALLEEQLGAANSQVDTLTKKYANLEQDVERKYTSQIDMLKSEREAWNERADHVVSLHKYTDKLKLTGMVVAVAAALGIGVIIGCVVMSRQPAPQSLPQQDPASQTAIDAEGGDGGTVFHYFIDGEEVGEDEVPEDVKNGVSEALGGHADAGDGQ